MITGSARFRHLGLMIAWLFVAFGLEASLLERAKVVSVSSSGRSFILDTGHLEEVNVGQFAQIVKVSKEDLLSPRISESGLAEVVKVTPRQSYWYFHEQNRSEALRVGQSIEMIRENSALKGLRTQRVHQRNVVLGSRQQIRDNNFDRDEGVPRELLSQSEEDFYDVEELELDQVDSEKFDLETSEYDVWTQKGQKEYVEDAQQELDVKFASELNEVSDPELARRKDEKDVFKSYVRTIINQVNSSEQGLQELYQKDLSKSYKNHVSTVLDQRNLYHRVTNPEDLSMGKIPDSIKKARRDGDLWSVPLNDQQLRSKLIEQARYEEYHKKEKAKSEGPAHEVLFRASTGLMKHTSEQDANFQNVNYSLSMSYEYALKRASDALMQWSVEAEIYTGINFYEMAPEFNGRFQEGGYGLNLNYYFHNNPFTVEKMAFYGGLGIKRSSANGGSKLLEGPQSYDYQVLTLPSFHIGAKYRFKAGDTYMRGFNMGVGVNALLSYESKNLSIISDELITAPVYSSFDIQDTRLSVGLSLYF